MTFVTTRKTWPHGITMHRFSTRDALIFHIQKVPITQWAQ
jgi:hypothetical protein